MLTPARVVRRPSSACGLRISQTAYVSDGETGPSSYTLPIPTRRVMTTTTTTQHTVFLHPRWLADYIPQGGYNSFCDVLTTTRLLAWRKLVPDQYLQCSCSVSYQLLHGLSFDHFLNHYHQYQHSTPRLDSLSLLFWRLSTWFLRLVHRL